MDRRVDRTRRALKRALVALSVRRKPEELSVAEIAAAAGINRVTFYAHYRGIDELIEDVLLDIVAEVEAAQIPPAAAEGRDAADVVLGNLRAAVDAMAANAALIRWAMAASRGAGFRCSLADGVRALILRRATALGARLDTPTADAYLDYAAEGCAGAMLRWIEGGRTGPEEFARALAVALAEHPYSALGIPRA